MFREEIYISRIPQNSGDVISISYFCARPGAADQVKGARVSCIFTLRTPGKDQEVFERGYYIPVRSGMPFDRVCFGG